MTNSSIGSGSAQDKNENHVKDGYPSKTMGAESESSVKENSDSETTPDNEVLPSTDFSEAADNPGGFPDGPNVAPNPWEKNAKVN